MKNIVNILILLLLNISLANAEVISQKEKGDDDSFASYKLDDSCVHIDDPWENFNRKVFTFNSVLDYFTLRPIAVTYIAIIPEAGREKINNAFENIQQPMSAINYGLQGRFGKMLLNSWKFILNSTFGLAGTHDFAGRHTKDDLKTQDFGTTLAYYGVPTGPYLIIPFIGSSSMRDITKIANNMANPITYQLKSPADTGYTAVNTVDNRAVILPVTENISKNSVDPYAAIRSFYHQNREKDLEYPANMGPKCNPNFYK